MEILSTTKVQVVIYKVFRRIYIDGGEKGSFKFDISMNTNITILTAKHTFVTFAESALLLF